MIRCITLLLAVLVGLAPGLSAENYIKWVDCNYSYDALDTVYAACVEAHGTARQFAFADMLGFLAFKNGNRFTSADKKIFRAAMDELAAGRSLDEQGGDNKYWRYHRECARAIFSQFVGLYEQDGKTHFGLKAYFPLAQGHWYNHYDDFGNSRSYGYRRRHLGHDIMGSIGTPIVAIEGGTVTEAGWNRYGGWRVGVRSDDGLRYYYYAHLRKGKPYAAGIEVGARVSAGQTLGYLGRTGYSNTPNTNLKTGDPHLHVGLQLIFDPSQEKGAKEIWVDMYAITRFLSRLRARCVADEATGDKVAVDLRKSLTPEPRTQGA
ncbi:MAG: M23 family metallopeptidase [Clostridia bacterium]|nr:M23 family metallopeptidase [Clostridia bacterium]